MAKNLIRFRDEAGGVDWGVIAGERVSPLGCGDLSTAQLLAARPWRGPPGRGRPLAGLELLAPVTAPCRVLCQGANYRQHMIESGVDPDDKQFNLFFTKSDASLAPPCGRIVRPAHVRLLDYELELGLVIGRAIDRQTSIADVGPYVAALVMANDVSARDVQLPQSQWYKGKSYRTFCPVGPHLAVLEPGDAALLERLELRLEVNGEVRQRDSTANLVYKPAESLSELSAVTDLSVGDLVLTGTPAGCALRAPGRLLQRVAGLLDERTKWRLFVSGQARSPRYLRPGDRVRSTIRTADGAIDLGEQALEVAAERAERPGETA
jgi:2-keto-4-pentenoate hydratase/2-oxohepta-3-ene-1,7-dioic acid hydratase in catechol pathway